MPEHRVLSRSCGVLRAPGRSMVPPSPAARQRRTLPHSVVDTRVLGVRVGGGCPTNARTTRSPTPAAGTLASIAIPRAATHLGTYSTSRTLIHGWLTLQLQPRARQHRL